MSFAEQRLKARLLAAAMRRCDQFEDGDAAREAMRRECLAVPVRRWEELLGYFREMVEG